MSSLARSLLVVTFSIGLIAIVIGVYNLVSCLNYSVCSTIVPIPGGAALVGVGFGLIIVGISGCVLLTAYSKDQSENEESELEPVSSDETSEEESTPPPSVPDITPDNSEGWASRW